MWGIPDNKKTWGIHDWSFLSSQEPFNNVPSSLDLSKSTYVCFIYNMQDFSLYWIGQIGGSTSVPPSQKWQYWIVILFLQFSHPVERFEGKEQTCFILVSPAFSWACGPHTLLNECMNESVPKGQWNILCGAQISPLCLTAFQTLNLEVLTCVPANGALRCPRAMPRASGLTVCCLKDPPKGMPTRDKERTKTTVLKCKEGMRSSRKLPRKENPRKDFGSIVPRCFQVLSPFAVAWKTATLESRENKAEELWGFPKLKQNCISLKCAHTLTHT